MFGKLRFRFILISMLSVILVLGAIIVAINAINYRETLRNADDILELLANNDGQFPMMPDIDGMEDPPEMPEGGRFPQMPMDPMMRSPELAYESRYFSVLLDRDGNVIFSDTGMIAAVTPHEAEALAQEVFGLSKDKGFSGDYRYLKVKSGDDTRIIFYDCGRSLASFRTFRSASILISASGTVIVFLLIFFASGRIVRPVAESYEKQKRFITDAGHEIKTPLAIINADADVILSEGESQWADDIKGQVGRLTELTNNLIYLSKMEEGQTDIPMIRTDLSGVVTKSCESFASRYITENRILSKDIETEVFVKGDEKSLGQLMSILLDNALKYSPEGGKTEVSLKKTSKGIRLTVTNDTVNVIDKESSDKLFDRFYRTDKSRNSETGGHGIGLSIAKAIVTAHKGRITANPSDEKKLAINVTFIEG